MSYGKYAYRGFYEGKWLRSYNEFLYAMYMDRVMNFKFKPEPFALLSKDETISKKKIPDFLVYEPLTEKMYLDICVTKKKLDKYFNSNLLEYYNFIEGSVSNG